MNYETKVERGACALYLASGVSVSDDDVEAGFRWLKTWDVLMPVKNYERLAFQYAHEDCSRSELEAIVKDARQMVYDERVMFIKHGSSAEDLLRARELEICKDDDCPLPMLRAIWMAKPLLLALPESWVVEEAC